MLNKLHFQKKTAQTLSERMLKTYLIGLLLLSSYFATAATYHVKTTGSDGNTGTSWGDAFATVQKALSSAASGDEIWVAAGTYYPTTSTDRYASFIMQPGVAIYGGFPATGTPTMAARNWDAHLTTLSGDIGTFGDNTDNSYHVIFNDDNSLDATAILDGFTITGGNASVFSYPHYYGGGMYNRSSSPTISNTTFSDNFAVFSGGGMFNDESSPTISNSTFSENSANGGGGMYNDDSSPTISNSTFSENSAYSGGGMFNDESSPTISNSTFSDNSANSQGGGMFNHDNSSPTVENTIFSNNSANDYGGGMSNDESSPTISNSTFSDNSANYSGGGMYNNISSPTISNSVFSDNSANGGGGMYNFSSSPTISNSTFSDNSADYGGGMLNYYSSSPTISNCILWDDENVDEILNNNNSYPTITYSIVRGDYAGIGNKDEDPLFIDPENGDLRIPSCSPAVDAGLDANAPALDKDGNSRYDAIAGGVITDMGAFEFQEGGNNAGCNEPPVAACKNITVDADGNCQGTAVAADFDNGSSDPDGDEITFSVSPEGPYPLGDTDVTLTVSDGTLSSTCTATVTVVDNTKPTLSCAGLSFTVPNGKDKCGAEVALPVPTASDNCGVTWFKFRYRSVDENNNNTGPWSSWANPADADGFFAVGKYKIQWRAKDAANNKRTCSSYLTVEDTQQPDIECFDQDIVFNGEEHIALVLANLSDASDNCEIAAHFLDINEVSCEELGSSITVTSTVEDVNGLENSCTSTVTVLGLPCGWSDSPIACDGNTTYDVPSETFTLSSIDCHNAITNQSDEYAFATYNLCGNGEITAKVTSVIGNSNGWAGVVMREDASPTSKSVAMLTNLSSNHRREVRSVTGGNVASQLSTAFNRHWLRIKRVGNSFRIYASSNGSSWFLRSSQTVSMNSCIEVGLVVNGYNGSSDITATFENVTVTGNTFFGLQTSSGNQLEEAVTGIENKLLVYPNPTKGAFEVVWNNPSAARTQVQVFNSQGMLIQSVESDENTMNFDLSGLPAGMYMVHLKMPNGIVQTKRLILQH